MSKETQAILTNKEVIAVNQDPLGVQGFKYATRENLEIWVKPMQGGDWTVCFLNRGIAPQRVEFDWKKESIKDDLAKRELNAQTSAYEILDLWTRNKSGTANTPFDATVPGHDVVMLSLRVTHPSVGADH